MRPLSRWLRLLVLCLLIPAYGLAAAGVSSYLGDEPTVERLRVDGHRTDRLPQPAPSGVSADSQASSIGAPAGKTPSFTLLNADDIAALMLEHGDTSDDMSEHCAPHLTVAVTPFVAVDAPAAAPTRSPDAPPGRLQRPPRG